MQMCNSVVVGHSNMISESSGWWLISELSPRTTRRWYAGRHRSWTTSLPSPHAEIGHTLWAASSPGTYQLQMLAVVSNLSRAGPLPVLSTPSSVHRQTVNSCHGRLEQNTSISKLKALPVWDTMDTKRVAVLSHMPSWSRPNKNLLACGQDHHPNSTHDALTGPQPAKRQKMRR